MKWIKKLIGKWWDAKAYNRLAKGWMVCNGGAPDGVVFDGIVANIEDCYDLESERDGYKNDVKRQKTTIGKQELEILEYKKADEKRAAMERHNRPKQKFVVDINDFEQRGVECQVWDNRCGFFNYDKNGHYVDVMVLDKSPMCVEVVK